jgi:hypothetical protein
MTELFDKNFYPTPRDVALKMLAKFKKIPEFILEPSSGKGDLLDVIKEKWFNPYGANKRLYCIEKDRNLQHILTGKGYNLIDSDFLTYSGSMQFSGIIMNPPFDDGASHLLKAWNILYNGEIVCLLNQETYDNAHTKERRLLRDIIDKNGNIERLGSCFDTAERKTDVEVIMVYLKKENSIEKDYFEGLKASENYRRAESLVNEHQLTEKNNIENMVLQYNKAIEKVTEGFIKLQEASWYSGNITDEYGNPTRGYNENGLIARLFNEANYTENLNATLNAYIAKLKIGAWQKILNITQFQEAMTDKIRRNFESRIHVLQQMEFTVENIENLLHRLRMDGDNIINQAVLDAFDLITKYHKENRVHFEGWKTNKAWKIGKRFILPQVVEFNNWGGGGSFNFNHWQRRQYEIQDIEKVCAMLDGKKRPLDTVAQSLDRNKERKTGECSYFKLKWFKKGTMHFEFRDLKLLERFNYIACLGKKWLPPSDCKEPEAERIMIEYNNV